MDCKQGTRHISQQMVDLLRQLDDDIYSKPLGIFNHSSIGQHFRHIIDFYSCLLKGGSHGTVDYSERERNPLVETNCLTAISVLEDINRQVQSVDETSMIQVRSDFSTRESEGRICISSSMGRELMFAYDHAIHHLALIKIGLKAHFPHITIDENLGVAPSTIKFKQGKVEESRYLRESCAHPPPSCR